MANPRRPRDPCIPGLVPQAFIEGSWHQAPVPALRTSQVDERSGHCTFQWEATGSTGDTYDIQATGKLETALDSHGNLVGIGLTVTCSCPDGQRQALRGQSQHKIIVCKHGAAALNSVLDEEAVARHQADLTRRQQQRSEAAARKREEEGRAREQQERDMPGERDRIEYGLKALSKSEIKKHLEASCLTVEGLRAMAVLFPETIMPRPQTKHCVRCKEQYDDRNREQKVCRMEHPYEFQHTRWDGSKISWQHCYRCDGDFGVPGHYHRGPDDVGEWCFQGEHTQDENLVKEELWDADPGDLF